MTTLAQSRANARFWVDETKATKWTDAELTTLTNQSLSQLMTELATAGLTTFATTSTVTANSGIVDLSSLNPLRILNLMEVRSSVNYVVRPIMLRNASRLTTGAISLQITYIAQSPALVSDSDVLVYGNTINNGVFDRYISLDVAKHALIKDWRSAPGGAVDPQIEDALAKCRAIINQMVQEPSSYSDTYKSLYSLYGWAAINHNEIRLFQRV